MAKKKISMPLLRVDCSDLVVVDSEDNKIMPREGEWAMMYKRIPARLVRVLMNAQVNVADEESASNLGETLDELIPPLAKIIQAWNWTDIWDEKRPLLPSPSEEVLWDLDIEEIFYLVGKLMEQSAAPKAPD